MYDRQPTPGKENRVRITQDNGQVVEGVLAYADDATQDGSAYCKANVLPDDVCDAIGVNRATAEPKDAFIEINDGVQSNSQAIEVIESNAQDMENQINNIKTTGLSQIIGGNQWVYTDSGTFVAPYAGYYVAEVIGSGANMSSFSGQRAPGAGGYARKRVLLQKNQSVAVTIGQTSSGYSNGSTTSFGSFCSASGGSGNSSGGDGVNGDLNLKGGYGINVRQSNNVDVAKIAGSSFGGYGFGGAMSVTGETTSTVGYGAGIIANWSEARNGICIITFVGNDWSGS